MLCSAGAYADIPATIQATIKSMDVERLRNLHKILSESGKSIRINDIAKLYARFLNDPVQLKKIIKADEAIKDTLLRYSLKTYEESILESETEINEVYLKLHELFGQKDGSFFKKDIDPVLLRELYLAVSRQIKIAEEPNKNWSLPSAGQEFLFEEEKKRLSASGQLILLGASGMAEHRVDPVAGCFESWYPCLSDLSADIIDVSDNRDVDYSTFVLWHELGHAVHRDVSHKFSASVKKDKNYEEFLNDPLFVKDMKKVAYYTRSGMEVLDDSSELGKKIRDAVAKAQDQRQLAQDENPFWIRPVLPHLLKYYSYMRGTEQRADLFACRQLFNRGLINAIMRFVESLIDIEKNPGGEVYAVSESFYGFVQDEHPSDLERAVYIIGFLAAHGVDVNAALRDFEVRGTCVDAENLQAMLAYINQNKNAQCAAQK